MTVHSLFRTLVYTARLQRTGAAEFNRRLLRECEQLRLDDAAGRKWSAKNYPGGYTSYGSPGLKLEDPRLDRYMGAPPRVSISFNYSWF